MQDSPSHVLGSTGSLRRDPLFGKDAVADESGGQLGREDC